MTSPAPAVRQLAHGTYVWAAEVPRVAALARRGTAHRLPDALALVRAFVTDAPEGAALQLRYESPGTGGAAARPVLLIGRARTEEDAHTLAGLVQLTLPATHALRPVDEDDLPARLVPIDLDAAAPSHVAEIRRVADLVEAGRPTVLPWPATGTDIDLADLLERAPAGTLACLHLERAAIDDEVVGHLHSMVRELRDELELDTDPTLHRALAAHRVWLRELPRGAAHFRVMLAADGPLAPGLADLVGLALAGSAPGEAGSGYEVVRPSSRHELDLALQLVETLRAGAWGTPGDHESAGLRFLFGTGEAAAAFRLPVIAEDEERADANARASFPATCARLRRLHAGPDAGPFLVIDLSRGDYAGLTEELRRTTGPVRRLRLDAGVAALDPFAVPAGSSRHAYAGRVLAALDLAYRFSEQSPASWVILSRAVYDAYEAAAPGAPTLGEVITAADAALNQLAAGYELRASLLGRLGLLGAGPLGAVLSSGLEVDWADLLATPTVIELGGLTGPHERALVAALLLAGVLSQREAMPLAPGDRHLVVIAGLDRLDADADEQGAGVASLLDAMAAAAGSGQQFLATEPSAAPSSALLVAPEAWHLPIRPAASAAVPAVAGAL